MGCVVLVRNAVGKPSHLGKSVRYNQPLSHGHCLPRRQSLKQHLLFDLIIKERERERKQMRKISPGTSTTVSHNAMPLWVGRALLCNLPAPS